MKSGVAMTMLLGLLRGAGPIFHQNDHSMKDAKPADYKKPNGSRELDRRKRQVEKKIITEANGLVRISEDQP